ncbi:MAG: PHP-associated domain-containing protein [Candidatus Omnitrophica bacterium]|nr:PHP-associated domain-containing protein [Candidatus Omnitrophota bacterium]MDD5574234.1 PHP-associated domain-containing protein [Candidatus Omnitrophota bacterium]
MMTIDFHVHSRYSFDCFLEPRKIIELARRHHIDGLAITDHDTMAGVADFRALAPDLTIIAGQEISAPCGDILGLFLKREVRERRDVGRIVEEIRGQGGLAVLAHPFKWPHLVRSDDLLRQFDAIELFNARNNIPLPRWENLMAARAVRRLGLSWVAGSDTHEGFELGCGMTVFDFPASAATEDKIKDAIRNKRVARKGREVGLAPEIVSHFSRLVRSWHIR